MESARGRKDRTKGAPGGLFKEELKNRSRSKVTPKFLPDKLEATEMILQSQGLSKEVFSVLESSLKFD